MSFVEYDGWKRIFRSCLASNISRINRWSIVAVLISCLCLVIWLTAGTDSYLSYHHDLSEDRGWLPEIDKQNEKLQCKPLLRAARQIIDGDEILLPFNNNDTLWPFKKRVAKSFLLNNINYGNETESPAKRSERFKHYNVSGSEIKVRKILVTFGHRCCLKSRQRALKHAREFGDFDFVRSFDLDSLHPKFRQTHANVLKARRGAGYWLWKPYILLKTLLENMEKGDLVMYQDAGVYIIRPVAPLLKLCQDSANGIIVFNLKAIEGDFTKEDAFILMHMDIPEARQTYQRLASFIVVKKTCSSIQFVMEWLAYLSDRRIASDDANTMGIPNAKSFRGHFHDQSVLSLLSKKWGIAGLRDPSQYGRKNHYGLYQQLVVHDRFRN